MQSNQIVFLDSTAEIAMTVRPGKSFSIKISLIYFESIFKVLEN